MTPLTLTLPDDLYEQVVRAASEEGQTVEEFIIATLERYLSKPEAKASEEDA